eukprot:2296425-Pleurochrysis_carterae.AAC.1
MKRHVQGEQVEHGSWVMDSLAKARRLEKRVARAAESDETERNAQASTSHQPSSPPVRRSPRNGQRADRRQ